MKQEHGTMQGVLGFLMIVDIQHVLNGIFHDANIVYSIPEYQRQYDWKQKHCERLFSDILALVQQPKKEHFLGTMVMMKDLGRVDRCKFFVIDGQQRLTTLSLLLKAIQDVAQSRDEMTLVRDTEVFLGNAAEARFYRLDTQQQEYAELMADPQLVTGNSNIALNYQYFCSQLQSVSDLNALLAAMNRCSIITIQLEEGKDSPQLIFETLNSTGKPLSEADKIRNYLLLTDKNITPLNALWNKLNSLLKLDVDMAPDAQLQILNDFFATYLMCKTRKIILQEDQYEELRNFARIIKWLVCGS